MTRYSGRIKENEETKRNQSLPMYLSFVHFCAVIDHFSSCVLSATTSVLFTLSPSPVFLPGVQRRTSPELLLCIQQLYTLMGNRLPGL